MASPSTLVLTLFFLLLSPLVSAEKLIRSNALTTCMPNSNFTASLFDLVFTPSNGSVAIEVEGVSSISGNITAQLDVYAYGFKIISTELDPCFADFDLAGMCPMNTGPFHLPPSAVTIPGDGLDAVPGVAYTVPDIDLFVQVYIKGKDSGNTLACLETRLDNDKTVYHKGVSWAVAVIAGLGLVVSAVTSGLGHSNTAAHVAANALSLFGFMQAQAMIGLTSVTLPPIVQSWTQNFQWSMGIINVDFLQSLCTWYQRATGGEPSTLLSSLSSTTVKVLKKRTIQFADGFGHDLAKRTNNNEEGTGNENFKKATVRGIERVGFRAGIERTNIFMMGFIYFVFFVVVVLGLVAAFKGVCELAAKKGWMKSDKFQDFRNGWRIVLRGILFRLVRLCLCSL